VIARSSWSQSGNLPPSCGRIDTLGTSAFKTRPVELGSINKNREKFFRDNHGSSSSFCSPSQRPQGPERLVIFSPLGRDASRPARRLLGVCADPSCSQRERLKKPYLFRVALGALRVKEYHSGVHAKLPDRGRSWRAQPPQTVYPRK
jgi:hypothetical protein